MLAHTVEEVQLKNGAKGLFIDVPGASVMNFRISFRAGDVYTVADEKWETAHIMEHLSLGANKKFASSSLFQATLEKNGAYSNASTGPVDMTYDAECADFEWEEFTQLFTMGISQPLFLTEEFDAECGNVYQELIGRGNNHSSRLSQELAQRYGFKGKTFQQRKDLMKNVTLYDVLEHYKRTHFSQNMRFVIGGHIRGRKTKLIEILESMKLPKSTAERFEAPLELPTSIEEPVFIENTTVPNAYFYIDTYRCAELNPTQLYSLSLLNTMLTDTLYSKILGKAREKGLIYYLSSSFYRTEGHSCWWFGSQIAEEQLKPFLRIFVDELLAVKAGKISAKDIDAAKKYQLGGFQRDAQSVHALVNGYLGLYLYNGKINDYYVRFPKILEKITKADMVAVANEMFSDNKWGVGFLGTISEKARQSAYKQIAPLWQ